jgi:primosomal protein N' (replication factor Y)
MFVLEDHPSPPERSGAAYAQILVDLGAKALDKRTFTYRIPEEFRQDVHIGTPVMVSFGRMPQVLGFVVGFCDTVTETFAIKDIAEVLEDTPLFSLEYLQFLDWVSDYYATPLTQVLSCALPANLVQKTRKEVTLARPVSTVELTQLSREAQRIVVYLQKRPQGCSVNYLATQLKLPNKLLQKTLAALKQLEMVDIRTQVKKSQGARMMKVVHLLTRDEAVLASATRRQKQILEYLLAHEEQERGVLLKALLESVETTLPTVQRMEAQGLIRLEEVSWARDPLAYYAALGKVHAFSLSDAQARAVETVLNGDSDSPYLLYGVTGSGKTEVYLTLAEQVLRQGQSVMMMVPEIALTSQISKRFIERFGIEQIALWHSNLSAGEKADTWRRVASGDLRIVIGARSAIFTPVQQLGLILIDEEHDGSFKQDSPAPRYHAKSLALELARRTGAKVVCGSATPDPMAFYHSSREHRLLHLPERFGGRSMARVELVDMKQERSHGNGGTLSRRLKEELTANVESQEQSIILINRRGFYTLITCVECDYTFMCPHCTVALTVHRSRRQVRCHYCGYEADTPQFCPSCASGELSQTGVGTQRVEDELYALLPEARVLRLDSDVMQRKDAYREVFEAFSAGEADILVGTQMVAKGLDVPNVTLVGVISADASFYLPDYKSSERGFQLLTQVAGRAGRGEKAGRVVVQSVDPNHAVIQYAKAQDYEGFYQYEIAARRELAFPPFSQLFRFIVSDEDEFRAQHFIKAMGLNLLALLEKHGIQDAVELLGPAPCVISRIQGRFRFHALLKNQAGPAAHRLINGFFRDVTPPEGIHFLLDVEPQSLL